MKRRRIWCETLPIAEVASASVVRLLERFDLEPIVAVRPEDGINAAIALVRRYHERNVPVALWPMLDDVDGRWANVANVDRFVTFTDLLSRELERAGATPNEIVVDVEPSIARVRDALAGPAARVGLDAVQELGSRLRELLAGDDHARAERAIGALAARLKKRGSSVSAALLPTVLAQHAHLWHRLLGMPTDAVAWDEANVMLYTSILEGWSRGTLRRSDARAALASASSAAAARFGSRASVSLGAIGTGAFGNEPTYRDVSELEDDVAIAEAAGISRLVLFDLGGALARPPVEAWLDAFTRPSPSQPMRAPANAHTTVRLRLAFAAVDMAGVAIAAVERVTKKPRALSV